ATAGLPHQGAEGLSHRRAARPRHGGDDGSLSHPEGRGHPAARDLPGAQALISLALMPLALTPTVVRPHPYPPFSKEKANGLEETAYRRDRRRHGNQLLRLRRPQEISLSNGFAPALSVAPLADVVVLRRPQ